MLLFTRQVGEQFHRLERAHEGWERRTTIWREAFLRDRSELGKARYLRAHRGWVRAWNRIRKLHSQYVVGGTDALNWDGNSQAVGGQGAMVAGRDPRG